MVACTVHNAMHCRMFKKAGPELLFNSLLSLALGHPVQLYVPTHNNNHHAHTQTQEDHIHTAKVQFRYHWLNLLTYFFHIIPAVVEVESQWIKARIRDRSPILKKVFAQAAVLYSGYALGIYLDWYRFIACVWLPGYMGIYSILTMNMLQHDGCVLSQEAQGRMMDVDNSRNFTDPWLNYFLMNNGYHAVHHMYPGAHWSKYAELHETLIKPRNCPELDEPSMSGYIWRAYFAPGKLPTFRALNKGFASTESVKRVDNYLKVTKAD